MSLVKFLDFPSIWFKLDSNVTREVLFPWQFYIFIWMTDFAIIGLSSMLKNGWFLPSHLSMLGIKFHLFFWGPNPGYRSNKSYVQSINKTAFWVYSHHLSLILNGRQHSVLQQWVQCFWLAKHTETSQSHCFGTCTVQKTVSISFLLFVLPHCIYFAFRSTQDPLVHHGCHFGHTVHSFCSIQTLLTNGILSMVEELEVNSLSAAYVAFLMSGQPFWPPDHREQKELEVFCELLKMVPALEAWLMQSSEEEVINIADLIRWVISAAAHTDPNPRFRKV